MSKLITIARPYARAAFEFAIQHQTIASWQSMLLFASQLISNKYMEKLLSSTVITNKKIADIFIIVSGNQLNNNGQNFIRIMAYKRRLLLLPYVYKIFLQLCTEYNSTVEIEIISVSPLKRHQIVKINQVMTKYLSKKVKINYIIDTSIIAGIIVRIGDNVIDSSVLSRLEHLGKYLSK